MFSRRAVINSAIAAATLRAARSEPAPPAFPTLRAKIPVLEKHSGGRLGVAVLNTATNASCAWRGDERFAFCSTFKFLLAAAILQRIDHG